MEWRKTSLPLRRRRPADSLRGARPWQPSHLFWEFFYVSYQEANVVHLGTDSGGLVPAALGVASGAWGAGHMPSL